MKVDVRDGWVYGVFNPDPWAWRVFDKRTGKDITKEHIIAADDSTGQIIRYVSKDSKDREISNSWPIISEIRDIELVCTEWP